MREVRISRQEFLGTAARLVVGAAATASLVRPAFASNGGQPELPNILLIMSDDQGYGDLGCFGSTTIKTPNLDKLAAEGVRMTNFYVGSPLCTPSRVGLMTGRYPFSQYFASRDTNNTFKTWNENSHMSDGAGLPPNVPTVAEELKKLGYSTAIFGKWHLGLGAERKDLFPTARGFDEFYGFIGGLHDYYTHLREGKPDLWRGTEPVQEEGYTTDLLTRESLRFIDQRKGADKPFFLYLAYNAPHGPIEAPDKWIEQYSASIDDPKKRVYPAMVTCMDDSIGQILGRLEQNGLAQNTIVIFFSDNGAIGGNNAPFSGRKATLREGGIRSPFIARWPGHIPANSTVNEIGSQIDIFATCVSAAGGELTDEPPLDGKDIMPSMTGKAPSPHEFLVWQFDKQWAIREKEWKLVDLGTGQAELYNLIEDPAESKNLAAEKPELVKELKQKWENTCLPRH